VPLRIHKGVLASPALLKKYDLTNVYWDLIEAIKDGNVREWEQGFVKNKILFVKFGILNLMGQCKHLVNRTLVQKIVEYYKELNPAAGKSVKIDLTVLEQCFQEIAGSSA